MKSSIKFLTDLNYQKKIIQSERGALIMLTVEMCYTEIHCKHICKCDKAHNLSLRGKRGYEKEIMFTPVSLFLS